MKTTNYEISKQLAEAKFKANQVWNQEGQFWGYDFETILDALPESVKVDNKWAWFEMDKNFIIYEFDDGTCLFDFHKQENGSLADTAARLWLKLKKEGLV